MHNPFKPETKGNFVYWRNPTRAEINFGAGAIHYAEFEPDDCINPETGKPKLWFKSPYDGLRYNYLR